LTLAPMADVTDGAFREIIAKYGKPDVFWTEFVSADGLVLAPKKGQIRLLEVLKFSKKEKPIVAQLFGSNPANMEKAAALVEKLGFDGLDINMGCPDRSIEKQNSGAAMIKNPTLAKEIIAAAMRGAQKIPISVKIRLGYNQDILEEWLMQILAMNPAMVTVHARTRKEMSKVPARWDRIKDAVKIRDALKSPTLIFGNGDVISIKDAKQKAKQTGCDGVMIGRGIFGKPWFFSGKNPDLKKRLKILIEHIRLFDKLIQHKNFAVMRKHFKAYVEGFDGAKELRRELMETNSAGEAIGVLANFIKTL